MSPGRRIEHGAGDDVPLTKAVRAALRAEISRTGTTAIQLLDGVDGLPDGLTPGIVNRWIGGMIRSAPSAHFAYVTERWKALPNNPGHMASDGCTISKRGKRYPTGSGAALEVTVGMAAQLRSELARTAVDHATLLDGVANIPNGLTARIIAGWLYRHAATVKAAHWNFVIDHLGSLPDRTTPRSLLRRRRKASDS